jgi:predicted O-methyltransferase YrrM
MIKSLKKKSNRKSNRNSNKKSNKNKQIPRNINEFFKYYKKFKISDKDYNDYKLNMNKVIKNISGNVYQLADNWFSQINIYNYKNKPITYLEIGAHYGSNLISVALSYGSHKNSKLYAIDPWIDYDEYPEYKDEQNKIYNTFTNNIDTSGVKDKVVIKRGYSNIEVPKFQDEFFDIIYIDGNHEPEFVLEDAVLSFRKLKKNGIMIFDDYGWGGPALTMKGIDAFVSGYYKKIKVIAIVKTQFFLQKI